MISTITYPKSLFALWFIFKSIEKTATHKFGVPHIAFFSLLFYESTTAKAFQCKKNKSIGLRGCEPIKSNQIFFYIYNFKWQHSSANFFINAFLMAHTAYLEKTDDPCIIIEKLRTIKNSLILPLNWCARIKNSFFFFFHHYGLMMNWNKSEILKNRNESEWERQSEVEITFTICLCLPF